MLLRSFVGNASVTRQGAARAQQALDHVRQTHDPGHPALGGHHGDAPHAVVQEELGGVRLGVVGIHRDRIPAHVVGDGGRGRRPRLSQERREVAGEELRVAELLEMSSWRSTVSSATTTRISRRPRRGRACPASRGPTRPGGQPRDRARPGSSGHARALAGLAEGHWIDVRSAPSDLASDLGRFELAKDVSAFANSDGGLIVIPGSTRNEANGEVIDEIRDLELDLVNPDQIRATLASWVYPIVRGLEVKVIETSPGRGQHGG
jgi:hypothetical protein